MAQVADVAAGETGGTDLRRALGLPRMLLFILGGRAGGRDFTS